VHYAALQQASSVYVATETFVVQYEGEPCKITAFAVLRETYEVAASPIHVSLPVSAFQATCNDLVFDFVMVPTNVYPDEPSDWLDGQLLVKHIQSARVMSAIWDLSRVPDGPHHPHSVTFRYLRRSFLPVETRWLLTQALNLSLNLLTHSLAPAHE